MKIKSEVLLACYNYVNKRIANYKNEIETIKESIESNDKTVVMKMIQETGNSLMILRKTLSISQSPRKC